MLVCSTAFGAGNSYFGTFTGNGNGLTNIAYSNLVNRLLFANLKDFGAKGDGTTDDSTAVQAWSTYGTANNLNLYAPAGNYKITTTINYAAPTGNSFLFGSWKIWGDGPDATQFTQTTTNAHIMSFTNGASLGLYVDSINFKGAFTGANAISSCGIYIPSGAGNNQSIIHNCAFQNLYAGVFTYLEDVKLDSDTFQDNQSYGAWMPNQGSGNNNVTFLNCQFTEGPLSTIIATNSFQQIGIKIDGGSGHVIQGCTFTTLNANGIAMQLQCSANLIGDYGECNGCGKVLFLFATNGVYKTWVMGCTFNTGGADGNTNHYPVVVTNNSELILIGSSSISGWSSLSPYRIDETTFSSVEYDGFVPPSVDEYFNGSYLDTRLITPNPLLLANATSTNAVGATGQTLTIENSHGVGYVAYQLTLDGSVIANGYGFLGTTNQNFHGAGPFIQVQNNGTQLLILPGTSGILCNDQLNNGTNLWLMDNSGNWTFYNGSLAVNNGTLTVSGTGPSSFAGTVSVAGTNTILGGTTAATTNYSIFQFPTVGSGNIRLQYNAQNNKPYGNVEFSNPLGAYLPFYGIFVGDGSGLTNIAATNLPGLTTNGLTSYIQTFTVGTPFTNTMAFRELITDLSVSYNVALVAGRCTLNWTVTGTNGTSNSLSQVTVALIGSSTGNMSNAVPTIEVDPGAVLTFTDGSTGTGNSVTLPIQGKINYIQQLAIATSTNFVGNGAGLTNTPMIGLYSSVVTTNLTGTADQSIVGGSASANSTLNLVAGTYKSGDTWHINLHSIVTNGSGSTATMTGKLRLGTNVLISTTSGTIANNANSTFVNPDLMIKCLSTGTNGTFTAGGDFQIDGLIAWPWYSAASVTVDTTSNEAINVSFLWSSSSANCVLYMRNFDVFKTTAP